MVQVEPDLLGNAGHLWQCFPSTAVIRLIARGCYKRGDDIVAIAEGNNFIPFSACPLNPRLSPFFAAVVVPSPWMTLTKYLL